MQHSSCGQYGTAHLWWRYGSTRTKEAHCGREMSSAHPFFHRATGNKAKADNNPERDLYRSQCVIYRNFDCTKKFLVFTHGANNSSRGCVNEAYASYHDTLRGMI